MKMLKDSKAVSPVIGVMLMLVVTVILAAAVSSTSSGLMKSTDKAPTAVFDVKLSQGDYDSLMGAYIDSLTIKQVTGDSIPTSDLKIITVNPNTNGMQTIETVPGVINFNTYTQGVAPWWNNGNGVTDETVFGNYTLKSGTSMVADSWSNYVNPNATTWNETTGQYDGFDITTDNIDALHTMFANYDSIEEGDWVTIKIVHMPTQKVIFQTDVEVK